MNNDSTDHEWRCHHCSAKLGVRRGDHIHIKRKDVQVVVTGRVTAVCPSCNRLNEMETTETRSAA